MIFLEVIIGMATRHRLRLQETPKISSKTKLAILLESKRFICSLVSEWVRINNGVLTTS